ncbi:hypothetical protein VPH35_064350 [Triticum aestivum]
MAVAAVLPTPLELPAAGLGHLHLGALCQLPPVLISSCPSCSNQPRPRRFAGAPPPCFASACIPIMPEDKPLEQEGFSCPNPQGELLPCAPPPVPSARHCPTPPPHPSRAVTSVAPMASCIACFWTSKNVAKNRTRMHRLQDFRQVPLRADSPVHNSDAPSLTMNGFMSDPVFEPQASSSTTVVVNLTRPSVQLRPAMQQAPLPSTCTTTFDMYPYIALKCQVPRRDPEHIRNLVRLST